MAVLIVACVTCGMLAGTLLRGAAFGSGGPVDQQEQLARGAAAAQAASSVLVAVRWHAEGVSISKARCAGRTTAEWRCSVAFRDGEGKDLEGRRAPRVDLRLSGRAERAVLAACLLTDPEMGRAVDCTARARAALANSR
ncbi:MAG: hypothetical protein V9E83_01370 [Baekduia sp.]